MATVFSRIVSGEIPCHKVAETPDFLAFLDIRPLTAGHTVVIPKKEIDLIFDLDDETYIGLLVLSKMIAKSIAEAIPCKRVGMAVVGLEVPHAHVHLVPLQGIEDINFSKERQTFSDSQLAEIAEKIRLKL